MFDDIRQIVKFRALVWALVQRHLILRYRGSVLGFLWTLLNPLCLMLVYVLVFKFYVRFEAVQNYAVFVFCGLLPWIWTTTSINESTVSIVNSGHLITKSLFPPHILPVVAIFTNLINFLLSLPILFILMFVQGQPLSLTILFLPVIVFLHALLLYGIGLALASLNVHFRDIQHLIGNFLTFLFFLCPILYPANVVPEVFRFSLQFNPFAILTSAYQEVLLNGNVPDLSGLVLLTLFSLVLYYFGVRVFNRYRESFAEAL